MLHLFNEVPVFVVVILLVGVVAGIVGAVRHFSSRDIPCEFCGAFKWEVFSPFAGDEGCVLCNNLETQALYDASVVARDEAAYERKSRDNRTHEARAALHHDERDFFGGNDEATVFESKWGMNPKIALKRHNSSRVVKTPKFYGMSS
jgi:hypothetical protein